MIRIGVMDEGGIEQQMDHLLGIDATLGTDAWTGREFRLDLPEKFRHSRWALDEAGVPVGFAVVSRKGESVHVHRLVVEPARRREKIGRTLLRAVAESARASGLERMTLKVSSANEAAIRFYEALGFEREKMENENLVLGIAVVMLLGADHPAGPG